MVGMTVADTVDRFRDEVQRCVRANTSASCGLSPGFNGLELTVAVDQTCLKHMLDDNREDFRRFCQVEPGGNCEVYVVPNNHQLRLFKLLEGVSAVYVFASTLASCCMCLCCCNVFVLLHGVCVVACWC